MPISNDKTYLLRQSYLNDQNRRANHSYLSSPGRTISSCNNKKISWITFRTIIIYFYSFIIIIIDYIILPTLVLLFLTSMGFMIINQCSNKILNEYENNSTNTNEITSNCQCIVDYDKNEFDTCICHGIDDAHSDIIHNGFIRIFCVALLVFIMEYLSLICLFWYLLCKCICCGTECCCKCWRNLKTSNKGYCLFVFGRIIGCIACGYFMHFNSMNVSCGCPGNQDIDYCGPWQLDKYMKLIWQYCQLYIIICILYLTGKTIIKCLIRRKRWWQYKDKTLIRMVLYKK